MTYILEDIGEALRQARERKGFSQRELSAKAGVRQAQISQVENGAIDLRLSSLIALARALDLELELVPRKVVPAVDSLVRDTQRVPAVSNKQIQKAVLEASRAAQIFSNENLPQLKELARALANLRTEFQSPSFQGELQKTLTLYREAAKQLSDLPKNNRLQDAMRTLQHLRNAAVHAPQLEYEDQRPAYSLEEDDDE